MAKKLRDIIRSSVGIDDNPTPTPKPTLKDAVAQTVKNFNASQPKQAISPFDHPMRRIAGGNLRDVVRRSVGLRPKKANQVADCESIVDEELCQDLADRDAKLTRRSDRSIAEGALVVKSSQTVTMDDLIAVVRQVETNINALIVKSRAQQAQPTRRLSASEVRNSINRNARRPQDGFTMRRVEGSTDNIGRGRAALSVRDAVRRSVGLTPKREFHGQGYAARDAMTVERTKHAGQYRKLNSAGNARGQFGYIDPYTGGKFVSYEAYLKYGFKPQPRGVPAPVGLPVKVG